LKRVVFDHNVPARLARLLKAFDITLARDRGWDQLSNGKLLEAAESSGYYVLLTGDKSIHEEQNMGHRRIGMVSMSANNWKIVRDYVPEIAEALHKCKPGQVLPVYCGDFLPAKFRKPEV
jgi:hypothetical protein